MGRGRNRVVEMSEGHCGEMVLTNHAVTNRHCLPLIMHLSSAIRKIPSRTRRMGVAANYMIYGGPWENSLFFHTWVHETSVEVF